MKRLAGRIERGFSQHFPSLYYNLIQRPRFQFRFKTEKRLAQGQSLSKSTHQSVLFFTTQKCASRYVSEVLTTLNEAAGMVHADYDAYVAMVKVDVKKNPFSPNGSVYTAFKSTGYYYGPIGTFRSIPNMEKYKVLLQLRDPRDVLTSLYFSTVYSHAVISPKLIRRRQEAKHLDVDDFVLLAAEEYLPIYQTYCKQLLANKNMLFVKYEKMVEDFDGWLQNVAEHLNLDNEVDALAEIKRKANFSVPSEDKFAQRRQVTPGDHQRKLRAQTIETLNKNFSSILRQLGYPV